MEDPLSPNLLHTEWSTIRKVLHDVLVDMQVSSVQDFLLHPSPSKDFAILTSPERLLRGFSYTSRTVGNTDGIENLSVELFVPTEMNEEYICGINLLSFDPRGLAKAVLNQPDVSGHFIVNTSTCNILSISIGEASNVVKVFYTSALRGAQIIMHFPHSEFMQSFNQVTYAIDFDRLEQSVILAFYAEIAAQAMPVLPSCSGDFLQGYVPGAMQRGVLSGDFVTRGETRVYFKGTLVRFKKARLYNSRIRGAYAGAVFHLSTWGAQHCLSQMTPVIQNPLSSQYDGNDCTGNVGQQSQAKILANTTRAPLTQRLPTNAPAPTSVANSAPQRPLGWTYADEIDLRRKQKIERRKEKNRQAAARSYEKRRQRELLESENS